MPDPDPTTTPATGAEPVELIPARPIPDCPFPLTGCPGELIDRLAWAIDQDDPPLVTRWWAEIGMIIVVAVGGAAAEVMPRVRTEPNRLDDDATRRGVVRVGRMTYVAAIRARLFELVDDGIDERFLVRSLRDEVAAFLASDYLAVSTSVTHVDELVARVRTDERLRARLRDLNPYFAERSDPEILDELTNSGHGATDALTQWAAQDAWATTSDAAVSDRHLDEWLHGGRQVRRQAPRLRVVSPTPPPTGATRES